MNYYHEKGRTQYRNTQNQEWKMIIDKAMMESPPWRELMKDNGLIDRFAKNNRDLKTTQLRKFFESVRKLKDSLMGNKPWPQIEGELWMVVPLVKYAKGRKLVTEDFNSFVVYGIEKVTEGNDEEDKKRKLNNFIKVFEAVVAYHKYHYPKE